MKYKSFGLAASIILAALAPSAAMAQSLGGSITSKEVDSYVSGWPDLISTATWSAWTYTDAGGVVHTFNGSTKATYHYIYYSDGREPKCTGIVYTSLTNVQATDGSIYYLTAKGGDATVTAYDTLYPKYQVLSVIYAPPGTGANVDYSSSTGVGNTTNVSRQFTQGETFTVSVGVDAKYGSASASSSSGWSESTTQSHSITVNKSATNSISASGQVSPAPAYGIDHDYDQIVICPSPMVQFSASVSNNSTAPAPPNWTLSTDPRDTTAGSDPDIIFLTVAELKNPSLITNPDVLARLSRAWAGPNEGLTTEDFSNILARDPFCNDGTNGTRPVIDTLKTNNRFQQVGSVSYQPLYPGQGPQSMSGSLQYSGIDSKSQQVIDTYTVSMGIKGDIKFGINVGIESTSNYTWTNTASESITVSQGQTATYSIPRPPSNWMGKTVINVYQDTVYGTFFFSY